MATNNIGTITQITGAVVDVREYPGMPHTINQDEMDACRLLLESVVSRVTPSNSR